MGATRNGFQNFVNQQPAPAEAGDFAGTNPRMSLAAPANGYVADSAGVVVGRFAWGDYATGIASSAQQADSLLGFVHRENQGLITEFLGYYSMITIQGAPVTLMSRGDFWAFFASGAEVGDPVYADPADGSVTVTAGGNVLTPFYVASPVPVDAVVTASIAASGVMTVTAVSSGVLDKGQFLTGTGIPNNSIITGQLTGTPGGTGTYQTTVRKVVTSTAVTGSAGKLGKISTWQQ